MNLWHFGGEKKSLYKYFVKMRSSLHSQHLLQYIQSQLMNSFPDGLDSKLLKETHVIKALERVEFCFKHVKLSSYNKSGEVVFNHLYSDHYLIFLWFLSNTIYLDYGPSNLANKIYYLNKSLHSFDCLYNNNLPDIFIIFHGVATVLGKAHYSNFFISYQAVTVGASNGVYPVINEGVSLMAHSSLIGSCHVDKFTTISSNTHIFNKDIDKRKLVYRNEKGEQVITDSEISYSEKIFYI